MEVFNKGEHDIENIYIYIWENGDMTWNYENMVI